MAPQARSKGDGLQIELDEMSARTNRERLIEQAAKEEHLNALMIEPDHLSSADGYRIHNPDPCFKELRGHVERLEAERTEAARGVPLEANQNRDYRPLNPRRRR